MNIDEKKALWITVIAAVISIAVSALFLKEGTEQSFYYWIWFFATVLSSLAFVCFAAINCKYKEYDPYRIVAFNSYSLLLGVVSALTVITNTVRNSFFYLLAVILIANVLVFFLPGKLHKKE